MSPPPTPENTTPPTGNSVDSESTQVGETTHDDAVKPDQSKSGGPNEKSSNLELVLLLLSVFLSMFVVAVDRTIISTVRIHSIEQSWHYDDFYLSPCETLC